MKFTFAQTDSFELNSYLIRFVEFLLVTLFCSLAFDGCDGRVVSTDFQGGNVVEEKYPTNRSNDTDYLNKEYSPSMWSKRYLNGVDVVGEHVSFVTEESRRVRSMYQHETISYGNNFNETYDIYGSGLPSDAPLFIYIHGGYWQMLVKNISAYCVQPLIEAGIKVIVLRYDLCPTVTLTELVEQVTKFGEFILKKQDYAKSERIILAGYSAGAHLVLCMIDKLLNNAISERLRIDSIYLISGIYDLNELQFTNNNENNILSINDDNVNQLSPLKFDYANAGWQLQQQITINIYVGQYESPTFIRQSMELYLRFSGEFSVNIQLLTEYDHFEIVEHLSRKSYVITKSIIGSDRSLANGNITTGSTTLMLTVILTQLLNVYLSE